MKLRFTQDGLATIDWGNGSIQSSSVHESAKTLGQLRGIFRDLTAFEAMDPNLVIYRVQWISPAEVGTEGGLLFGNTAIEPGRVGDEYFMTHGHFHEKPSRGEFYATVSGRGILLLMDRDGHCSAEQMLPGSIHYVGANLAHRTVNIGDTVLRFVACWPSDAGHDYATIAQLGFSMRVVCRNSSPALIDSRD